MAKYKEYGYDIQDGKAIIPEWETEIKEEAFEYCKELTSVEFPLWIKKIGNSAFNGCENLTSITIPPSVTEIGYGAFAWCSSLTSISVSKNNKVYDSREDCNAIIHTGSNTLISGCMNTIIPPSVTEIEESAFFGCSSLARISIPESVTEIGEDAFSGCSSLKRITVSKDNNVYDSREDCNAIIHTESNTLIRGCENTIIPPSVTKIGNWAFSHCSSLTSITIPPSVTEIAKSAFYGCSSLTEVRIPKGCEVSESAFDGCPNVQIVRY